MTKKELAITLSKLKLFENPSMMLEQHPTDSEIAADCLWQAMMLGDIEGKIIADFGAGTGILGLGACLLGAKRAYLIDTDQAALVIAEENKLWLEEKTGMRLDAAFSIGDIRLFDEKADVVIMNPPFGTKNKNVDSEFLLKAMSVSKIIYSFHKASTKAFIDRLAKDNGFLVTHYSEHGFPLKQTMAHHKKRIERIQVGLWRFVKA